jgi:hypothetical protein
LQDPATGAAAALVLNVNVTLTTLSPACTSGTIIRNCAAPAVNGLCGRFWTMEALADA